MVSNQSTLGQKFRSRRSAHIRQLIDAIHTEKGSCRIMDLGGTEDYWRLFDPSYLKSRNVSIDLVNPLPSGTTSGIFTYIRADACHVAQAADNSYDLVHSNSTIEHVGDWARMKAFAVEVRLLDMAQFRFLFPDAQIIRERVFPFTKSLIAIKSRPDP